MFPGHFQTVQAVYGFQHLVAVVVEAQWSEFNVQSPLFQGRTGAETLGW